MAEVVLLSVTSKILSTISTPAFILPYQKASSILGAEKDLQSLKHTIQTMKAKLQDVVDYKLQDSATVKNWMERIGDVLHEAEDLFDEVAANELLKNPAEGKRILKEVRDCCSKLNPIISGYFVAKEVKDIRKRLENISTDHASVQHDRPIGGNSNQMTGSGSYLINPEGIVGRDDDLAKIKSLLFSTKRSDSILAVVGIGGMGKTTLARLIYNDDIVQDKFQKRWWACISNTCNGKTDVLLRIYESIKGEIYGGRHSQLECVISKMVMKTRDDRRDYLLVLDDVWDNNLGLWVDIIPLLTGGARGSKIIVTSQFSSVAEAMGANICGLEGLSVEESRELFRRIAFTQGQENDPRMNRLGDEIVTKCANVPLAIRSVAELLRAKPDIQHWQSIRDDPNLQYEGDDSIMSRLRLSFDHLPPDLKPCFAYCSLFPRNCKIVKEELIYLWIAQGYVKPERKEITFEAVGNGYFNELVRRFFFQDIEKDEHDEIITCQMLGLFHQLAQEMAGSQSVILSEPNSYFERKPLHLTIGFKMVNSWGVPQSWFIADRLRSSLFLYRGGSLSALVLDELSTKFKFLRALDLEDLKIEKVSSSVGELKLLRYLNLSGNTFASLPSSVSKLVNLHTLDISYCGQLRDLPNDFRKLINLRVLNARGCCSLKHMPPRFGKFNPLQCLSYFNVGEDTDHTKISKLLKMVHIDRDESPQLPETVRVLNIENPTMAMPYWDIPSLLPNVVKLHLSSSQTITYLPPLRRLSSLKVLQLSKLEQLQYIEKDEGGQRATTDAGSSMPFFPCLESLIVKDLPKLEGWSSEVEKDAVNQSIAANAHSKMHQFPFLFCLRIQDCPKLKSMPLSTCLQTLELRCADEDLVQQLLSAACSHSSTSSTPSSSLTGLTIWSCFRQSFLFESLTSLRRLELGFCVELKSLLLAPVEHNVLEELKIQDCPNLESYGQQGNTDVDWDALPNLRVVKRDEIQMQRDGH